MNDVFIYIFSYLFFINLLAFFLMGLDKLKAKQRGFRVPEATIFTLAIFGGSVGAGLGMYYFHHKTKHWYFVYGLPTIFAAQVIGVLLLLYYYEPTIF